jgi:hypothetical protein
MKLPMLCLALAAGLAAPAAFAAAPAPAPIQATATAPVTKTASTVVVRRHHGPFGGTRVVKKRYSVGPMGRRCKTVTVRRKGPMGHVTIRKTRRCR